MLTLSLDLSLCLSLPSLASVCDCVYMFLIFVCFVSLKELDEISKEADAEQKSETEKENRLLKLRDRVRKKAGANLTAHVKDGR